MVGLGFRGSGELIMAAITTTLTLLLSVFGIISLISIIEVCPAPSQCVHAGSSLNEGPCLGPQYSTYGTLIKRTPKKGP